jgi:peptidyl-prolyl cis-trans isomerase B (cyclophilin B)
VGVLTAPGSPDPYPCRVTDQPPAGAGTDEPGDDSGRAGPFPPVSSPNAPGRPPGPYAGAASGAFPVLPTPFPAGPASGAPTFPPGPPPYPPPAPFHQMGPGGYPPPAPARSNGVLLAIIGGALGLLLIVACGAVVLLRATGSDDPPPAARPPVAGSTAAPAAGSLECGVTPVSPPPAYPVPGPPDLSSVPRTGTATMRLTTDLGVLTIAMDRARTPCTVANFAHLAQRGFLANSSCHRLVSEGIFVLQCGDPTGTGAGGPGYSFADENLAGARYARGVVAMANAGPNTNGSQFFIIYRDSLDLPAMYTPFGTVTSGLDIVERVAAGGFTQPGVSDGAPRTPLTLRAVAVT